MTGGGYGVAFCVGFVGLWKSFCIGDRLATDLECRTKG
jgi:hypothetical protein